MLEEIKLLLGISSTDFEKDELINLLIMQCTNEALDYTHRDSVCDLMGVINQMVIYRYNQLGVEGLNSESYSGMSYSYNQDYPEHILRMLKKYRKVIVI